MKREKVDRICLCVEEAWKKLPRKGKPAESEWSVLCAFVLEINESYIVVSIGTGNKVIGQQSRSLKGDILNDSHAEVIAKRALQRFFASQALLFFEQGARDGEQQTDSSLIFEKLNETTVKLKEDCKIHMYISQPPCGDASILEGLITTGAKRLVYNGEITTCSPESEVSRNIIGICRLKPGKGDPTLSMSCSDKISMWCCCGLQGSLLSRLIPIPIRPTSIITVIPAQLINVPDCERIVQMALERAIKGRILNSFPECSKIICEATTNVPPFKFRDPSLNSSGSAINWSLNGGHEVTLSGNGKKLGTTKASWNNPKQRSSLCKLSSFSRQEKDKSSDYNSRKRLALAFSLTSWTFIRLRGEEDFTMCNS